MSNRTPAHESPQSKAHDWFLVFVFVAMLAITVWATTRGWHNPVLDRHEFRQTQTAISTHWLKQDGFRLDYETPLFGPPWSIPMEFPVYQWIVARASSLLGTGLESTARGVSLFFFFATLPAVYGLAGMLGLAPLRRLLVVSSVLASPTYLFYGRSFMIETTALCCSAWFLYAVTRAVRDDRVLFAGLAALFAVLAGLAKVTTFAVFLLPAALLTWTYWRHSWNDRTRNPTRLWHATIHALAPVLLGVGTAYWWVRHSDNVKETNAFASFLISSKMTQWTWGSWAQRISAEFWTENWNNISGLVLGPVPLAVLLLCAALVEPVYRRTAAWCGVFFLGALLLFAHLYYKHDYYYCANAGFLLTGAGFLLVGIWDSARLPATAKGLVIALVLGGQLSLFYNSYGWYYRRELPRPPEIATVIRETVPPEGVVLIYGWDWNSLVPYYAQRRVVMVPNGREDQLEVLEGILHQLPPLRIAALLIRQRTPTPFAPDFIRERLNHFDLAPAPFATSADGDLYLPEEQIATAAEKFRGHPLATVTLNTRAPVDPNADKLRDNDLSALDLSMAVPKPVKARSMFGISTGLVGSQKVIFAHPVSELYFNPPAGARRIVAEVGIIDAAYAPSATGITDGISVEIIELRRNGLRRMLYRRDLNPAKVVEDRGPQTIHLDETDPLTGTVVFRITPGPYNNLVNDWAYWGRIEIN